ncbi:DUF805 domain-containing protein [Paracoccus litorisediminis]|uniref:DUF805 domain-containing protein n=1 Tax=Paracoccus litorisediminis TaxID=2006130 RepID=UPI00372E55B6
MNLFEAVGNVFANYATASGRASRSEYWWFTLFNIVVSVILGFIQGAQGAEFGISTIWVLVALLPGICVTIRRLHDLDRSGWWILVLLIPVVGYILLIVWFCMRGTAGANRFGPDPLAQFVY